jgi:hypothetical protein
MSRKKRAAISETSLTDWCEVGKEFFMCEAGSEFLQIIQACQS